MTEPEGILTTDVPGLDVVLGGGLSRRALGLIIGSPGAGKTVLASQIVFNAAQRGLKTLVITTYSEGVEQYVEHMGTFDFFEPSFVGSSVQVLTLQGLLTDEERTPALAIARSIRSVGAQVVLIDGFQGAGPLLPEGQSVRVLLSALATQTRYLNTTLLVTVAGDARNPQLHEELTASDFALSLIYTIQGRRHQRLLEVVKQRGRAQLAGLHSYRLDSSVRVFPRIETYPLPGKRPRTGGRAQFGLPELDVLLGGGLNTGTATLLAGAPGVGKTTLGLYWALANAQPDAISVILTFGEYPEQLQTKAAAFNLDLQDAIARGGVRIVRISAADLDPDYFASVVLQELTTRPVRRVVFDDVAVLLEELGERTRDYLSALNDILYGEDITSLYLLEIPPFDGLRINLVHTPSAVLGDNVIVVQQYEVNKELRRLLAVLRMRLSFFDQSLRELVLDEDGVRVLPVQESAEGVLEQGAHLSGGVAPDTEPHPKPDASLEA